MLDKSLYNTVLCQAFSPCGKYLVAGNIYGQLAVFDLDSVFNPVLELFTTDYNKPKYLHQLQNNNIQVCSLLSVDKFLIVGTVNEIVGWDWKTILSSKLNKQSWTIKLPQKTYMDQCDVNCLWYSEEEEKLYAGCGDNNVYVYNLDDGRLITSYQGHSNYIHSVHGSGRQLLSAGEDGQVLFWDTRTNKSVNKIEPHTNSKLARPDIGKWIGSASIGEDWIVCGGGPRLSLWNIRSLDAVTVFDIPDHGIHVSFFHDDCVVAGGAAKHLYQLSYSGQVRVELPVSATTVYSIILRTAPNRVLAIAGSSPEIDLCSTFNYKDQVLHFK